MAGKEGGSAVSSFIRRALLPLLFLRAVAVFAQSPDAVIIERLPEGAVQPQVAVDARGDAHLIYLKGDPPKCDIFYARRRPGDSVYGPPLRVNSQPGSAIAVGTVRGPRLAVDGAGRPHVAWIGSQPSEPRGPEGATPLLYARLADGGDSFDPQRNVMQWAAGLDGGAALAADDAGHVAVLWHAGPGAKDEAERSIYLAASSDGGRTFARERRIIEAPVGACGCCGMQATVTASGEVVALYRAATANHARDTCLLRWKPGEAAARLTKLQPWDVMTCPMSTFALAPVGARLAAAWETQGQVYFSRDALAESPSPIAATGRATNRKHPALAVAADGRMALAWAEGTGWQRGGAVAWQLYDAASNPVGETARRDGLPVWGMPAVYAGPDGRFVVLF